MTIEIRELTFECIIGVFESERNKPQRVIADVRIGYDFDNGFIDYAAVARTIKKRMQAEEFRLIEEAQIALHRALSEEFPSMESLSLTLCKPDILPDCRVGICHVSNFKKS